MHIVFLWGNLGERDHLGQPGVDTRKLLKCMFKKQDGGVNGIDLVHDRDRWRVLVNAVMNIRVK
jgi:hypothetical protein